ncbi:MAG: hypothetical protein PHO37_10195 [Kiritimatiellae bacterium]|nr:hypothetical protein [Kiritimatiellia bacterium]
MIDSNLVLYCLLRSQEPGDVPKFLLVKKNGTLTFPPTKFRLAEDLYTALARPMEQDLGLTPGTHFVEEELTMIPNSGESPRYPGLTKNWGLYPVVVSLSGEGWQQLAQTAARIEWPVLTLSLCKIITENNLHQKNAVFWPLERYFDP